MLDTALLEALSHVQTHQPLAAFVAPANTHLGDAQFERTVTAQLDKAENELREWISDGEAVNRQLWEAVAHAKAESEDPATLIADLEVRIAEAEAATIAATERLDPLAASALRWKRRARQLGGEPRRIVETAADRLLSIMEREQEVRGDFVLALKAVAAEFRPRGDSPVFDSGRELASYLRKMLAA